MFPFDQPPPTTFYLVLYLGTLLLHVVPMSYVLAGSTYLAALGLWETARGRASDGWLAIAASMRDWMPFALSVAITAGVAPLLFIQVLYKLPFYTANLLLFHRWMAILPVLIAAFYLLYLQKSSRFGARPPAYQAMVALGVFLAFGFVGWSWTENHLLSTQQPEQWAEHYAAGTWFYADPELPPRLALWWLGAFPTLAAILAWQTRTESDQGAASVGRVLSLVGLAGLVGSGMAGLVYFASLPEAVRGAITGQGAIYLGLAAVGWLGQCFSWAYATRGGLTDRARLGIGFSALLCVGCVTVLRELRRLQAIDISQWREQHADASRVGGLAAFLLFLTINAALITWVLRIVARRTPPSDQRSSG